MSRARHSQGGVAAIEFALAFPILFLILYGFVTFGAALYTQQAVSRAVQDGARAVALLDTAAAVTPVCNPTGDAVYGPIYDEVIESLAGAAVAPMAANGSISDRRTWLRNNICSTDHLEILEGPCPSGGGSCVVIRMDFPYGDADGTRFFPSINMPLIGGTESWMPDALSSRASVRL